MMVVDRKEVPTTLVRHSGVVPQSFLRGCLKSIKRHLTSPPSLGGTRVKVTQTWGIWGDSLGCIGNKTDFSNTL